MADRCAILSTGTELVLGEVDNTNDAAISQRLHEAGYTPSLHLTCGDNLEDLVNALAYAFSHVRLVVSTGGLGPTRDDLTRQAASNYFKTELVQDERSYTKLNAMAERLRLDLSEEQIQQAYMPAGAVPLDNPNGTANGWYYESNGHCLIALPGPPHECIPMLDSLLAGKHPLARSETHHQYAVRLLNAPESQIATLLNQHLPEIADTIRYRAHAPYLDIKVAAESPEALAKLEERLTELLQEFPSVPYGQDAFRLLRHKLLTQRRYFTIQDKATYGLFLSRLMTPELFVYFKDAGSDTLHIALDGLESYWLEADAAFSSLSLNCRLGDTTEEISLSIRTQSKHALSQACELAALNAFKFIR